MLELKTIEDVRVPAFVGRFRPDWSRPWVRDPVPEFGLIEVADGEQTYRIVGEGDVKRRRGTLLVRLWRKDRAFAFPGRRFTYVRLQIGGRWPFCYVSRTPLVHATERSLGWSWL
jgi:hypothetical protein